MRAIIIKDAQGRQVFGLDSETLQQLYKRGLRSFPLSGGLSIHLLADLPNAEDLYTQDDVDRLNVSRCGEGTTTHRSGTCAVD